MVVMRVIAMKPILVKVILYSIIALTLIKSAMLFAATQLGFWHERHEMRNTITIAALQLFQYEMQ